MTSQLLEVQLCSIHSARNRLTLEALPSPTMRGVAIMGDFTARHPDMEDYFGSYDRNDLRLHSYIGNYQLTRWDTGGATHSRGDTLDHIHTFDLIASQINLSSLPALFSAHVALRFLYCVPIQTTAPITC